MTPPEAREPPKLSRQGPSAYSISLVSASRDSPDQVLSRCLLLYDDLPLLRQSTSAVLPLATWLLLPTHWPAARLGIGECGRELGCFLKEVT
jgi:hypothetical protein